VKEQPGVKAGEKTYCLVSGVVITAGAEGKPSRKTGKHELWFCCAACAGYFDANRDKVLALRGLKLG
jgi:hypothetical protein